jgi:regulator of protease activity HflC (stomatin/prohibitin superfamily)
MTHLECTDIGETIKRGSRVKVLTPGIHWYWPIWTTFYCRPANVQTATLPTQALTTLDGKVVVVGGMVRYEFSRERSDVRQALIETDDVEGSLEDEALAIFCDFVTTRNLSEIQEKRTETNRSLTGRLATRLSNYGVRTLRAQLTDFSPCFTLNHVGLQKRQVAEKEEE